MKSKQLQYIALIALFALLIAGAVLVYNNLSNKYSPSDIVAEDPQEGTEEPTKVAAIDFTMLDTEGNSVNLSDYYGKPIVLNFWASWCPPCKSEFPHFEKAYSEIGDDVTFIMISLIDGQRETQEKANSFISDNGYTLPVYFDVDQEAAYIYQISSIPTSLFIDKEGYVVSGYRGAMDEEQLTAYIDTIK